MKKSPSTSGTGINGADLQKRRGRSLKRLGRGSKEQLSQEADMPSLRCESRLRAAGRRGGILAVRRVLSRVGKREFVRSGLSFVGRRKIIACSGILGDFDS